MPIRFCKHFHNRGASYDSLQTINRSDVWVAIYNLENGHYPMSNLTITCLDLMESGF